MGGHGHRRDVSESHMPLTTSHINEHEAPCDHELQQVRVDPASAYNEMPTSTYNNCNGDVTLTYNKASELNSRQAKNSTTSSQEERSTAMEIVKTAVAFFCLLISAFLNFFLLTIIHDIVPDHPLPDLVFLVIHQQRWAWAVGDVLSTINAVVGFVVVLLHRERVVILRRVFLLAAILYGLRAIVLGVTYLPPSFEHKETICQPRLNGTSMYATEIATRFVTYVVTLGLTSGQPQILCGDLMFSGHTVVLTIMYFTQLHYTPRGLWLLRYVVTPITFMGIAALVVSGGHYTMDVLIAYWLTSHVFWSYHQVFELPCNQRATAPLSRLWWFWLCWWFEANVPDGPMQNEWNWPFSRPESFHPVMTWLNAKLR